jgi:hypothetical protein
VPKVHFDDTSATFDVRFRVTGDRATFDTMSKIAERQERSVQSVLRRYTKLAFQTCIAAAPDAEAA